MRGHWLSGTRKLNKHYQSGAVATRYIYNGKLYSFGSTRLEYDFATNEFGFTYLSKQTLYTIPKMQGTLTFSGGYFPIGYMTDDFYIEVNGIRKTAQDIIDFFNSDNHFVSDGKRVLKWSLFQNFTFKTKLGEKMINNVYVLLWNEDYVNSMTEDTYYQMYKANWFTTFAAENVYEICSKAFARYSRNIGRVLNRYTWKYNESTYKIDYTEYHEYEFPGSSPVISYLDDSRPAEDYENFDILRTRLELNGNIINSNNNEVGYVNYSENVPRGRSVYNYDNLYVGSFGGILDELEGVRASNLEYSFETFDRINDLWYVDIGAPVSNGGDFTISDYKITANYTYRSE